MEEEEEHYEQPALAPPSKFGRKPLPVNTGVASTLCHKCAAEFC